MAQCAAPKTSDTIRESSRLRDRECPRPTGLSVDSLLHCNKGNGNGGNSVRKGESFTHISRQATLAKMTEGKKLYSRNGEILLIIV